MLENWFPDPSHVSEGGLPEVPPKQFGRRVSIIIEELSIQKCPSNAMDIWEEAYNLVIILLVSISGGG